MGPTLQRLALAVVDTLPTIEDVLVHCYVLSSPRVQVIEELDERSALTRQHLWLPEPQPANADSDGRVEAPEEGPALDPWESQPAEMKLADVLFYLRERHKYCLYCGCQVSVTHNIQIWA